MPPPQLLSSSSSHPFLLLSPVPASGVSETQAFFLWSYGPQHGPPSPGRSSCHVTVAVNAEGTLEPLPCCPLQPLAWWTGASCFHIASVFCFCRKKLLEMSLCAGRSSRMHPHALGPFGRLQNLLGLRGLQKGWLEARAQIPRSLTELAWPRL